MTVQDICILLGWTITDLSRRADINFDTAKKAYERNGDLSARVKRSIAEALGVNVGDIVW